MKTLDIKAVQAFVLIADLRSFTRTAEVLDTTQSAISLLLKRLELRIGRRLIERTPRLIRLSADGKAMLESARELLAAHGRMWKTAPGGHQRLAIGISHQLLGWQVPAILCAVKRQDPSLVIELAEGGSREIADAFYEGVFDAAFVLQHREQRQIGEVLFEEELGWIASPTWMPPVDMPLPLSTQGEKCAIRGIAVNALSDAGIAWSEVFIGKGSTLVGAAATAGLAVAVLPKRAAPIGTQDVGIRLGLPPIPSLEAVLFSSSRDARARAALRVISEAVTGESDNVRMRMVARVAKSADPRPIKAKA